MQDLYTPVAFSKSHRFGRLRSVQQSLLLLFFTFSFAHPVKADKCRELAAFRDWIQYRHVIDGEIPREIVDYDVAQGVYSVHRTGTGGDASEYDFEVHGNNGGVTNVDIDFYIRDEKSQFYANEVLYFEIYSANFRFGLFRGFAGRAVLPNTFTYKTITNEATLKIHRQLGAE